MRDINDVMEKMPDERRRRIEIMAEEMAVDVGLGQLRLELNLSQHKLAKTMGISQPAVAQIEQRGLDLKLLTLKRYIAALGGKVSLLVQMPTGEEKVFSI